MPGSDGNTPKVQLSGSGPAAPLTGHVADTAISPSLFPLCFFDAEMAAATKTGSTKQPHGMKLVGATMAQEALIPSAVDPLAGINRER
jgi:hypothetical protein